MYAVFDSNSAAQVSTLLNAGSIFKFSLNALISNSVLFVSFDILLSENP
jgi:hypothetical protein